MDIFWSSPNLKYKFITDQLRSTIEGNVFTRVCLSAGEGGRGGEVGVGYILSGFCLDRSCPRGGDWVQFRSGGRGGEGGVGYPNQVTLPLPLLLARSSLGKRRGGRG